MRHHDQGNSYKRKHLIGTGLQFQRLSPLSSGQEEWQHADMVLELHCDQERKEERCVEVVYWVWHGLFFIVT